MKNLYVFEDVLRDYSSGMIVMIADDFDECLKIAKEKYIYKEGDIEAAIKNGYYHVFPVENQDSLLVSYVYGGG